MKYCKLRSIMCVLLVATILFHFVAFTPGFAATCPHNNLDRSTIENYEPIIDNDESHELVCWMQTICLDCMEFVSSVELFREEEPHQFVEDGGTMTCVWCEYQTAKAAEQATPAPTPPSTRQDAGVSWKTARQLPYLEGCPLVSCGFCHTVMVNNDGTVKAYGANPCGECNVSSWRDIVQIEAGTYGTIGLKSDGTVVFVGDESAAYINKLNSWQGIKRVSAGAGVCLGLTENGDVLAAVSDMMGSAYTYQCCGAVEGWHDMVQVSAGVWLSVGLQKDGTIKVAGILDNQAVERDYGLHPDAIQISAGEGHFLVLNRDGTVDSYGKESHIAGTEDWTDIVQIACGYEESYGLRSDGTVVKAGHDMFGGNDVSGWRNVVMLVQTCGRNVMGICADGSIYFAGGSYAGVEIRNEKFEGFQQVNARLEEVQQWAAADEKADTEYPGTGDEQLQGYGVITGNHVPMYQKASNRSRVVDYLEKDAVVYISGQEEVNGVYWQAVTNEDNREGYIQEEQVRMMTIVEEEEYLASQNGFANTK